MKDYQDNEQLLRDSTAALDGTSALDDYDNEFGNDTNEYSAPPPIPEDVEITVAPDDAPEQDNQEREPISKSEYQEPVERNKPARTSARKAQAVRAQEKSARLQAIAEQQAYQLEMQQQQIDQLTKFAGIQREKQLEERAVSLSDIILQARNDGEEERATQANALLSELNAERAVLKLNKRDQYNAPAYSQPQQNYYQEPPEVNPILEQVVAEHDWLDNTSPNYDEGLVQEAAMAEEALARKYKLSGRGQEIDSIKFYKEVAHMVEERYGIAPTAKVKSTYPTQRRPMTNQRPQYVSPVNREQQSQGNISQSNGGIQVRLSAAEKDIARLMPMLDKNGLPMTDEAKYAAYARELYRDQRR